MIASVSDYRLVTPPSGMTVDGGIMPARDVAGDGSWRLLRGEDMCFLNEAAMRLLAYRSFGAHYTILPDLGIVARRVARQQLRQTISPIHDAAYYGKVWPSPPTPLSATDHYLEDVVPGRDSDTVRFVDGCLQSGCRSASASFLASTGDFPAGGALVADSVRRIYHDLAQVKGVLNTSGEFAWSSWVQEKWDAERQEEISPPPIQHTTTTISSYSYNSDVLTNTHYNDGTYYGEQIYTVVNNYGFTGFGAPSGGNGNLALLSPTTCLCIFRVSVRSGQLSYGDWGRGFDYSGYDAHEDAYVVPGTVTSAGGVACAFSTMALLNLCCAHGRIHSPSTYVPLGVAEYVRLTPVGIMFYDAGLDFSSINWQWPPAT